MTDAFEEDVRTAERQRCDAMVANDEAMLAELLDDRLHFHHATGAADDKAAYLEKIASGRILYRAIAWPEDGILQLAPGIALLTGRMVTDVEVEGVAKRLNNRVMAVWTRQAAGWRMTAFQSTPLAS
jgi:hypothetical protein